MSEPLEGGSTAEIPPEEQKLLAGADRRIDRAMWVLGILGAALCWLLRDGAWAASFALGAVISALNFHWLKTAVGALAELASAGSVLHSAQAARSGQRGVAAMLRFLFRYALIGVAGYAIFKSSFLSLAGFFLGLFLFLAAILVEIAYEVWRAFHDA